MLAQHAGLFFLFCLISNLHKALCQCLAYFNHFFLYLNNVFFSPPNPNVQMVKAVSREYTHPRVQHLSKPTGIAELD